MECADCGCALTAPNMPCYLYSCGHLACFMHVLGPFCSRHPADLLLADLGTDRVVGEMRDLLSKVEQKGYLYSCAAGIRADLQAYIQAIVRNGGLFAGQEQVWACPLCSSTHYASESLCPCGFSCISAIQYQETPSTGPALQPALQVPPVEEKAAVMTCEREVQVELSGEMTESRAKVTCESCKSTVPRLHWCADCIREQKPACFVCKQPVGLVEVRCEDCRAKPGPPPLYFPSIPDDDGSARVPPRPFQSKEQGFDIKEYMELQDDSEEEVPPEPASYTPRAIECIPAFGNSKQRSRDRDRPSRNQKVAKPAIKDQEFPSTSSPIALRSKLHPSPPKPEGNPRTSPLHGRQLRERK